MSFSHPRDRGRFPPGYNVTIRTGRLAHCNAISATVLEAQPRRSRSVMSPEVAVALHPPGQPGNPGPTETERGCLRVPRGPGLTPCDVPKHDILQSPSLGVGGSESCDCTPTGRCLCNDIVSRSARLLADDLYNTSPPSRRRRPRGRTRARPPPSPACREESTFEAEAP